MAFATICSSHSKSSQISKSAGLGWLQGCGTDGKKRTVLTRKAKKKKKAIILAPYYVQTRNEKAGGQKGGAAIVCSFPFYTRWKKGMSVQF